MKAAHAEVQRLRDEHAEPVGADPVLSGPRVGVGDEGVE